MYMLNQDVKCIESAWKIVEDSGPLGRASVQVWHVAEVRSSPSWFQAPADQFLHVWMHCHHRSTRQDRTWFPFSGLWVPNHARLELDYCYGSICDSVTNCEAIEVPSPSTASWRDNHSMAGQCSFSHPKAQALLGARLCIIVTCFFDMPTTFRYHIPTHLISAIKGEIVAITMCCSSNYREDFTPVCTTELSMCQSLVEEFQRRSVRGSVHLIFDVQSQKRNQKFIWITLNYSRWTIFDDVWNIMFLTGWDAFCSGLCQGSANRT